MADKKEEPPNLDNDYDPYAERKLEHPTNDVESLGHITKGILGTGILALPEGFSYAGGLMAIIYCFINVVACTTGIHILVTGFYMVCKAFQLPVVNYADAMTLGVSMGPPKLAKCSKAFGILTNCFILFFQGGAICVYMLFVAVTTQKITNNIVDREIPLAFYLLFMVIPFMLINSLKNLKILAPVSYFSLLIIILVIVLIFYYALRDELPSYSETRKYYNEIMKVPLFFGTTLYAFTSVPITVSVENNMLHPAHFYIVYDIAIIFLAIVYLSVSFVSYWRWGEELQSVVILNFPLEETVARVGNYLYALAIYLSLGLNGIVPVRLLMDTYISKKLESPHPILWEYILRFGFIALGLFLAITVPHIGLLISLLGAVSVSSLAMIFPGILDICCRYQQGYGKLKWRLVLDIVIIFYGCFGLITGVYVDILELSKTLSSF